MEKEIWLGSLRNAVDSLENSLIETGIPEEEAMEVQEMIASLSAIIDEHQTTSPTAKLNLEVSIGQVASDEWEVRVWDVDAEEHDEDLGRTFATETACTDYVRDELVRNKAYTVTHV